MAVFQKVIGWHVFFFLICILVEPDHTFWAVPSRFVDYFVVQGEKKLPLHLWRETSSVYQGILFTEILPEQML